MGRKEREWNLERKAMASKFSAVMGYRVPIRTAEGKQIAYTTRTRTIYISEKSPLTEGLDKPHARAVRFGLFVREMGRIQFTDFDYQNEVAKRLGNKNEEVLFIMLSNLLEEPSIEAFSPTYIGGYLLKSLKYAIKRAYDVSPPIDKAGSPFREFLEAVSQFGKMGPTKGHFTSIAAKKLYYRLAPEIGEIIKEGDPKKRIDMECEIFEVLRPLWSKEIEDITSSEFEEIMEELSSFIGSSYMPGIGAGVELDPEELADSADFSKGGYRKTTFKEVSELDEEEKEAYEASHSEEEIISDGEDEEEEEEKGSAGGTPYVSDESTVIYDADKDIDLSTLDDYDPMMDEIDVEGCDFFDRLIQSELEVEEADESLTEAPDFPAIAKKYTAREYKCLNRTTTLRNVETATQAYNDIVALYASQLDACYKKLKALFAEEGETTEYKTSGKISLKRVSSGTITAKMFTKKVEPKDRSNLAVMIAIDESGSMHGSRIERAKAAAINLAELFSRLKIPTYVMGYTADTAGADVVHNHYLMWSRNFDDRLKLTSMHADCDNFDGYSIRYASNVLSTRPEKHKLMIVISDGQPACDAYEGDAGYRDTKDAIREARGDGNIVLGVAIGADVSTLQNMYGNDFIFITTGEDLFTGISRKFSDMVKKW